MKGTPAESQPLRAEVVEWLMRLEEAPDDATLRARFQAWLAVSDRHRAAYTAVEPVWRNSARLLPPLTTPVAVASQVEGQPRRRPWRRATVAVIGAMAAGLTVIFLPALQVRLQADHLTGVAEQREITLEDGSKVALDAGSAIAVRYGTARREVELLSGQAFFEVVPNQSRPFIVAAAGAAATVTGTAFSVGTAASGVTVAVQSGSVDVSIPRGAQPAVQLTHGDRLQITRDGRILKGLIEADEVASWRNRQVVVYDMPVRDVVEQLGRYRSGVVIFRDSAIADRLVTGVINLDRPTEALQALVELQQGSMVEVTPYLSIISSR